ncbi:MAG: motility protein A [Ruminiclostridium sp.]|nr:motility protein A [Ruminiclostridium sp.]
MNITILIGWVVSIGLILYGIFSGGELGWFIDIPSLMITVGGTFGVLIAISPLSLLKQVPKFFKIALLPPKFKAEDYIAQIVDFANTARSKGLLALEDSANKCEDPFMKQSLMLIVDANDSAKVREMLEGSLSFMQERHEAGQNFFSKGASLAPAFGMLGTLVGLVIMLQNLEGGDLGPAMAVALITTFYGSFFANVVFTPLEAALKNADAAEVLCMQIIIEGVMAIAEGSNPRMIKEKLEFMLPKSAKKEEPKN